MSIPNLNPLPVLADFLEREGGRQALCILLILASAGLWKLGFPKADDLFVFALGVLARDMGSSVIKPRSAHAETSQPVSQS